MKKNSLLKTAIVACLSSILATMYIPKIESIMLSVDMFSYVIFITTIIISNLMLYSKEEINDWFLLKSNKTKDVKEISNTIYDFCKKYNTESLASTTHFVKYDVKNRDLANFFVRFLDKNTKQEIDDYLVSQEFEKKQSARNAKKIVSFNNVIITLGVIASYIYDSNVKGILLIAGIIGVYNMVVTSCIEKNIIIEDKILNVFKSISEDILLSKTPKSIEYKCESILGISDSYLTIDSLDSSDDYSYTGSTYTHTNNDSEDEEENVTIEKRKFKMFKIGKNKKNNKKPEKIEM